VIRAPIIFVIVAASGAGKGVLLRAVRDMGERHILVIPKVTTRRRKTTDGPEMVRVRTIDPAIYDIQYGNYKAQYGISTLAIYNALRAGRHCLLICSNMKSAIPTLIEKFGESIRLVYLYAPPNPEGTAANQILIGATSDEETRLRKDKVWAVFQYYVDNIQAFDHVLLNVGEPEDLADQMFRLVENYG
jgi:hypothetical protein